MATNNAVSFNQLKKSVFNMKNYTDAAVTNIKNINNNSIGVPLSLFPRLDGENDDTNRFTRAFAEFTNVVIDSNVTVSGINIPDNCKLSCNGVYTITTTGTITVGYQAYFIGDNLTIDASGCSTADLKIISLSKWSKAVLYQILGYQSSDSTKGSGATAIAIYCEYSDFVQVDILRAIKFCKIAFYVKSGASGTGNTINRSYFNCAWIGSCYKCFVADKSTSIMLDTSAYMEQCTIGYELRAGFYGSHYTRFDHVDNWFVNLLPEFRTRLGDFYIRGCTKTQLITQIKGAKVDNTQDYNTDDNLGIEENDRFFMYTTWHCSDGVIMPSDKDNPYEAQIVSDPNGRLALASGKAKIRLISAESIQRQGKENDNDTSGGTVITLGGDASKFVVERTNSDDSKTAVLSMDKIGLLSTRNGLSVGNATVGNANVDIKKGGVIFGRTPKTNAQNCMMFYNSDINKLQFVDKDGNNSNVILESDSATSDEVKTMLENVLGGDYSGKEN